MVLDVIKVIILLFIVCILLFK